MGEDDGLSLDFWVVDFGAGDCVFGAEVEVLDWNFFLVFGRVIGTCTLGRFQERKDRLLGRRLFCSFFEEGFYERYILFSVHALCIMISKFFLPIAVLEAHDSFHHTVHHSRSPDKTDRAA